MKQEEEKSVGLPDNAFRPLKPGDCQYSIIPDQIEAGTFMTAAVATKGDIMIKNVIPKHLEAISAKLIEIGAEVVEFDDAVRVSATKRLESTNIKTLPYPGFPTEQYHNPSGHQLGFFH